MNLRCRLLGHRWGYPRFHRDYTIPPGWRQVNCVRCGLMKPGSFDAQEEAEILAAVETEIDEMKGEQ